LDDKTESIASEFLANFHQLASALSEQATPILVSTSVWKNFIERRQEMESGILTPETNEYKMLVSLNSYRNRINFLSHHFNRQKNNKPIENKNLIIEKINNELH